MSKRTKYTMEQKKKGIIYGTGAWNKGDIIARSAMKQAYEMGKNV